MRTRPFEARDANAVAALYADYMRETFGEPSVLTADILLRDGLGARFSIVVVADWNDSPVGFAAWLWDYDLHNAVRGANIPDLYVAPPHRGRALAIRLVAAVAQAARREGGVYVRGEVLQNELQRLKLLRRLAVGFPGESVYLGGRAFREMSELADADLKTLIAKLPTLQASREP